MSPCQTESQKRVAELQAQRQSLLDELAACELQLRWAQWNAERESKKENMA